VSSSEIFALRKQGRSADALEMARVEYPEKASDIWLLRAYAWALYDHAKKLVDAYEAKQLSPTALSGQLTPYMREFAKIANPLRGDSTFSQMLRLAGKASKDWQEFLGFARWAGVNDFSDEDSVSFVNDQGKAIDSLQKRFTRAICRETATRAADPQSDQALIEWGLGILEQALRDEPNDQWLNYYQSKLHLAHGEVDLAIKRLAPVLRRQSRAAWPWVLLGEILEATRPEDALNCYTYASQLARKEQEVTKVRIHLAQRLALMERFNEAAQQASLALKYREQHGFKVPQELQHLLASDWYRQAVANNSLQHLPKVDTSAKALLQELDRQSLTYTPGVIDHINTEKELSYIATSVNTGFGLLHRKFAQLAALPPGTLVEVGCAEPEGPPLDWRLSEANVLPGLCETLAGSLERQEGKDFAFIRTARDDIFVPPALAKEFSAGQQYDVSCLAIRRTNKQGKTGWRAVRFIK
jgi:tetratricopeptide (TPR) repeat protein